MTKTKETQVKFIKKIKWKKALITIIYAIIISCIFFNIIFLINTGFSKRNYIRLGKLTFINMEDDLMEPEICKNDLVVLKKQEKTSIGDNIAYKLNNSSTDIRINKAMDIQEDKITTKSIKSYYYDIEQTTEGKVIGKQIGRIKHIGILIKVLQSKLITIFAFIFLILKFTYNKYIYIQMEKRRKKCVNGDGEN